VTLSRVLYPGSFDPIHNGHVEIVEAAVSLFGTVVVAVISNPQKTTGLFDLAERTALIEQSLAHLATVEVANSEGLTIDAARDLRCDFIVKVLRSASDFEIEMQMAQTNFAVAAVRTVFVPSATEHGYLASSFIREIARFGGDVSALVPVPVNRRLKERFHP
jgi:pantetheine-phosphate adenylyltransferase